jgi:hypothetical protein
MTTGKLGAWGPTSRGATHKRRITLDVDRPKRSRVKERESLKSEVWRQTQLNILQTVVLLDRITQQFRAHYVL